jgi:hypothetical protein
MLTKPDLTVEAATLQWLLSRLVCRLRTKLGFRYAQWQDVDSHFAQTVAEGYVHRERYQKESAAKKREIGPLPIIFIHYGNSQYLRYSLEQARNSNPLSPIHLIGDEGNNQYSFVKHHLYRDYFKEASKFASLYKHFCDQNQQWILFVFQRWFILKEFLRTHQLERCLHTDSDVMLYTDVTKDQQTFDEYDFTVSHGNMGSVFYVNTVEGLEKFCHFLMNVYSGKEQYYYDRMLAHFVCRQNNHLRGGATEMTALAYYAEGHFGEIGEVSQILDGAVHDTCITIPHPGFEMENGIKKIIWKANRPYGRHIRRGKEIRFKSLHFQGSSKSLMKDFLTPILTLDIQQEIDPR